MASTNDADTASCRNDPTEKARSSPIVTWWIEVANFQAKTDWIVMDRGNRSKILLALVGTLVLGACARRDISPPPLDPVPMARETYVIGVADVLMITVWKNPEVSLPRVPVRSDGMISIPLLDDLQAEGLQPMELKEVITREFSEYIAAPDVTVTVLQSNSRSISIMGEVGRTTQLALTRDLRVLEAIAMAGGFTNFADRGDVRIVRQEPDGTETEFRFDYNAYIKGNAAGTNIVLQPGDTIIVPD